MPRRATAILALCGDQLLREDQPGTQRELARGARRVARAAATLVREGFAVVVIAGAGPLIDRELLRDEESSTRIPPRPLYASLAAVQGTLGQLLAMEIRNELRRLRDERPVTALLGTTLVRRGDPSLSRPDRVVGPAHNAWRARQLQRDGEQRLIEDDRGGWRRLVPRPLPLELPELGAVEALLERGHVVVASAGGGIPVVVDARGQITGVEGVVDVYRLATLAGNDLGAELLALLIDDEQLFTNPGRSDQLAIEAIAAADLRELLTAGQFPHPTTGPLVEAALEFIDDGGARAVLTNVDKLAAALADRAGTRVAKVVEEDPGRRQILLFGDNSPHGGPASEES